MEIKDYFSIAKLDTEGGLRAIWTVYFVIYLSDEQFMLSRLKCVQTCYANEKCRNSFALLKIPPKIKV